MTGRFIVSLHDVAPPFEAEIRAQLERLAGLGVRRCALHVVPNWHGANPLPESRSLVDLLCRQRAAGSELVMHGVEHRRHGPLRGPGTLRLRASLFAGSASEFVTLGTADALHRIRQGRALFEEARLETPSAFCAPGWLLDPALLPVLVEGGIEHVIGMFSLHDTRGPRRYVLPAIGYMGASPLHEAGIVMLNVLVHSVSRRAATTVIYLHPQGNQKSRAVQRVFDHVARLVEAGWQCETYEAIAAGRPVA